MPFHRSLELRVDHTLTLTVATTLVSALPCRHHTELVLSASYPAVCSQMRRRRRRIEGSLETLITCRPPVNSRTSSRGRPSTLTSHPCLQRAGGEGALGPKPPLYPTAEVAGLFSAKSGTGL